MRIVVQVVVVVVVVVFIKKKKKKVRIGDLETGSDWKMSSSDSLPELLCRVGFPLYGITVLSPRHILVGGGGGAAKTGVKNGFVSPCPFVSRI